MLGGGKHVAGEVTALQPYCKMRVGGVVAKRFLVMSCNEKISSFSRKGPCMCNGSSEQCQPCRQALR